MKEKKFAKWLQLCLACQTVSAPGLRSPICYGRWVGQPGVFRRTFGWAWKLLCGGRTRGGVGGCSGAAAKETSPRRCWTCTVSCPAGYAAPYLTVFSENAIDVFDVRKAEWVQTVPLKKVRAARTPGPGPGLGGCWAARLTSVPAASGATPKPGGLPVPLWHGEGPPDLPQEPAGR